MTALVSVMVACVTAVGLPAEAGAPDKPTRTASLHHTMKAWLSQQHLPTIRQSPTAARAVSGDCDQAPVTDTRGDNKPFDILDTTVTSDCSQWTITTRLAKPVDVSRLDFWAYDIDSATGNASCNRTEYVMLTFVENRRLEGYVVRTPSCDPDDWSIVEMPTITRPDPSTLQVTITGARLGHPMPYKWYVSIDASGTGGYDAAPDRTWVLADVRPGQPMDLKVELFVTWAKVTWTFASSPGSGPVRYTVAIGKNGAPPTPVKRKPSTTPLSHKIENLTPGATYTVQVTASNPAGSGPPATIEFTADPVVAS